MSRSKNIFEVDASGLREVMGAVESWRHSAELVANVFDEFRGYDGRKKPSYCKVDLTRDGGIATLIVEDDGAGFSEISDIWTLFRTTKKRENASVSGRFNAGEKQLLATAMNAEIITSDQKVIFKNGTRSKRRIKPFDGTKITATFKWDNKEFANAIKQLTNLFPPNGLEYIVNDVKVGTPKQILTTRIELPTVVLSEVDGMNALRESWRMTNVEVLEPIDVPMLYELGIPICEIGKDFPYSMNVMQKVPVPISRDLVSEAYILRCIGKVLESSAFDGVKLLNNEHRLLPFIKGAFKYIVKEESLANLWKWMYDDAVAWSSDKEANIIAMEENMEVLPRGTFAPQTVDRLRNSGIMQSSYDMYGDKAENKRSVLRGDEGLSANAIRAVCPKCKNIFYID